MVFGPWYCSDVTLNLIAYIEFNNKEENNLDDPDLCLWVNYCDLYFRGTVRLHN